MHYSHHDGCGGGPRACYWSDWCYCCYWSLFSCPFGLKKTHIKCCTCLYIMNGMVHHMLYIYIYIPLKKRPPPLLKQEPNSLANMARMCFTRHWDMYIYSTSRIILYIILSQSGVILGRSDPWKKWSLEEGSIMPPPLSCPPFLNVCGCHSGVCSSNDTNISVQHFAPVISRSTDDLAVGRRSHIRQADGLVSDHVKYV